MNTVYIGSDIYKNKAFGNNHPLSYARQASVLEICKCLGWINDNNFITSPKADIDTLLQFHDKDYVMALKKADSAGRVDKKIREKYGFGTMENPLFRGVFARAATTVGGSVEAARQALTGRIAFHPAGGTHHGMKDRAHGFCYFNDPVFAILTMLNKGLSRIAYIDIDAHHGDGVEQAFLNDGRVFTASIHEENRWPYTGKIDEQGKTMLNIAVPKGLNDSEFELLFKQLILAKIKELDTQAIVVTCGTDALLHDPLSKMALSQNALWQAVMDLVDLNLPIVVLGGGGYNPWTTVRTWVGLWGLLSGQKLPESLPKCAVDILSGFDSDLIDEEDRLNTWTKTLFDKENKGIIRNEIKQIIRQLK